MSEKNTKAAVAVASVPVAAVPVLAPLKHDGRWYKPGETVELTKDEWLDLRGTGAVPAGPSDEEIEALKKGDGEPKE